MTDYEDELPDLDYTAFEHVQHFKSELDQKGIKNPEIWTGSHYEDSTPVFEVTAHSPMFADKGYHSKEYKLEGVTEEQFEDLMYDVWDAAFSELEK